MRCKKVQTSSGVFTVLLPNTVIDGDGFYISYNNYDTATYGSDTTALVLGQMEHFYILNGDHREEYLKIKDKGFKECLKYFKLNIKQINKFSEE